MKKIFKQVLEQESNVNSVVNLLNSESVDVVFVVDKSGVLVGCITNGDIRRAISLGATNQSKISEIMNKTPRMVYEDSSPLATYEAFSKGVTTVPLVDNNKVILDLLNLSDFRNIPIAEPNLGSRETELVNKAMASKWISSSGSYVMEFEEMFARFTGANYALSVCNGTQAIALALSTLGIGPGDEVIVPALTFGATANAVLQVGAIPVFVDVDQRNLGMTANYVKEVLSSRTRAILVVHLYGKPVELDAILSLAEERNILVIEDCAEALGTEFRGSHVGTKSDAGTFSFFANKTITTGEGGMVTFKERSLYEKAKMIRSHGFDPSNRYWHISWGTNFRMTNLQAAVGVGQMERVEHLVSKKIDNAQNYTNLITEHLSEFVNLPTELNWGVDSFWLYTIEFSSIQDIDKMMTFLMKKGIETRRIFPPLPNQPAFAKYIKKGTKFPNSEERYKSGLCLPSSTSISILEQTYVIKGIEEFLKLSKPINHE